MRKSGTGPGQGRLPELLAPSGSPEAFRAALAAGADAIYLSGKRFGARKFAANFSDGEILEGLRLAHARGVRVYVTVNTLIHDRELEPVAEYLVWLYESGVDAVLVQDAGVAALAREIVPDLPLHASTQMTIHNADGVLRAAEQGFSRVVLARELQLDEIQAIARRTGTTGVGLEVFAHGALCYSYSGQCLLSSAIGGRSGNRGMCAQPCRKPYTLVAGEGDAYGRPKMISDLQTDGHYLLSPRDLCTYRHLPELVSAPVSSLKIEGRMKSPEYVAIVVSTYRRALDAIAAGGWQPALEEEQDLLLAFNRMFTRGYLFGDRHGALMARDAPDNRGIRIGRVTGRDSRTGAVSISLDGPVVPATGDGLRFTDPAGRQEDWGFLLNNAPVVRNRKHITVVVPRPVAPDSSVYITSSHDLGARARQIIAHPPEGLARRLPVDLAVTVDAGGQISLDGRIRSASGNEVRVSGHPDLVLMPARSRPLTAGQLEAQLRKSGDTPFTVRNCTISYAGSLFAPVSELNRMRREFLAKMEEALIASSLPSKEESDRSRQQLAAAFAPRPLPAAPGGGDTTPASPPALIVYADTPEIVSAALREGCACICFEPAWVLPRHTCRPAEQGDQRSIRQQVRTVMALCRKAGVRFILKLPRITRDRYLDAVLPEIIALHQDGVSACMVENIGAAHAIHRLIPGMALYGAAGLNVFNHRTACHFSPLLQSLTLSPELSGEECRILIREARNRGCTVSFALLVQGVSEAMVTEDCLLEPVQHCRGDGPGRKDRSFFGIRDATGHIFPVVTDGECRTRIGNAVETCLIDHLPAIQKAGIGEVVIDARGRTGAYAGAVTRIYRQATGRMNTGRPEDPAGHAKDELRNLACGGITAGHFLRGLKE